MAVDSQTTELVRAVALLGSAVVAVPLFKRLGLGSVVGYLAAGVVIGPFGLALFHEPGAILTIAEFGVVLLLFIIGIELKPSRLCLRTGSRARCLPPSARRWRLPAPSTARRFRC